MKNLMRGAVGLGFVLLSVTGCKKERTVEITLETNPREGQVVQDDFIELQEGQAIGVRVVAVKKDRLRPRWSVEARSEDPRIVRVQETAGKKDKKEDGELFVISAPEAGSTEIRFRLDGRHEVYVDTLVTPRPDWEPSVPEAD